MIVLGRYKENYGKNEYPSMKPDIGALKADKKQIINYMKKCRITSFSPAIVHDVLSGERINHELTCMTDGLYAWRSDLIYYIDKYNLNLPEDFIKHIFKTAE